MSLLDKVPGELALFIGGLFTLRREKALRDANITHVLSILRSPFDREFVARFVHQQVEVDDVDDENFLEHFPACVKFIQDGLDAGGGVFVHCAMGKSRSATVVCAYLMHHYNISPAEALTRLREARPFCEPNDGFMVQLQLYHDMSMPDVLDDQPVYQRWLYQREVELSRACGQAPEVEKIRFEDEHVTRTDAGGFELRCRKCRYTLATSQFLIAHGPKPSTSLTRCAHHFLDPLSWMRSELEQGKLDGRFECPKCKTNVGKYAWQGMQCSCGEWIVPGISLAKGRIDEVKSRSNASLGIRLPPQSARRSSQENL